MIARLVLFVSALILSLAVVADTVIVMAAFALLDR